jgi:hypothetical protein
VCVHALNRFLEQYDLPLRDDRADDIFGIDTRQEQVLTK